MLFQIPGPPKAYIHQGATVQRTDPVPPTSQPDMARIAQQRMNRFLLEARLYVHQGATVQQTHPVPETSKPRHEPEVRQFEVLRQWNRYEVNVTPRFEGATIQQTHPLLFVQQPLRLAVKAAQPELRYPVDGGVTAAVPDVFKTATPEPKRFWPPWDVNRVVLGGGNMGPDQQMDGPTVQQTHPTPGVSNPTTYQLLVKDLARKLGGPTPQFDGATVQAWFIYPTSQPDFHFYPSTVHRYLPYPAPPQPVIITVDPRYDVYPQGQPDPARFTLLRFRQYAVDALPRLEGATVQQQYIFPVSQPEMTRVLLKEFARRLGGSTPQLDAPQQTYIFPVSQPEMTRVLLKEFARRFGGPIAQFDGATIQDTIPTPGVSQPELIRFALREYARRLGGPTPQFEGATTQQTYIFPVPTPDIRWFQRPAVQRSLELVELPILGPDQTWQPPPQGQLEVRAFLLRQDAWRYALRAIQIFNGFEISYPSILSLVGIYQPTITVTGAYQTDLAVTGSYEPIILITGVKD